jgi:PAS domain S-box-containing protein
VKKPDRELEEREVVEIAKSLKGDPLIGSFGTMVNDMFPICVVAGDGQGTILYANAKLLNFLGYEAAELIGKPLDTIIPPHSRDSHKHYRKGFMTRPSLRPMGREREVRILKKDGSVVRVMIALGPENEEEGVPKIGGSVTSVILPLDAGLGD